MAHKIMEGKAIPNVCFKYRVRTDGQDICFVDTENGGENPFEWCDVTTKDIFDGKRVVVFSLPGAYTPTCSTYQVPGFDEMYDEMRDLGVDEVYVLSVNDTFVMRQWMIHQGVKNLKFIPDGNGEFSRKMGTLVRKENLGFGWRSWRYAMVVNDGIIEKAFVEPHFGDNINEDPYVASTPENVLEYLQQHEA